MENNNEIEETYYKQKAPELIKKLKLMVDECLKIVGEEVGEKLSSDKKKAVVQGKMEAASSARWALNEIDQLERELNPEKFPEIEKEKKEEKVEKKFRPEDWAK
ncbi:hypothetical protein [Galbibacter sp. BG1]